MLCYNELTRLEGLEGLTHLHTLDLGHNSIRKVGTVSGPERSESERATHGDRRRRL